MLLVVCWSGFCAFTFCWFVLVCLLCLIVVAAYLLFVFISCVVHSIWFCLLWFAASLVLVTLGVCCSVWFVYVACSGFAFGCAVVDLCGLLVVFLCECFVVCVVFAGLVTSGCFDCSVYV